MALFRTAEELRMPAEGLRAVPRSVSRKLKRERVKRGAELGYSVRFSDNSPEKLRRTLIGSSMWYEDIDPGFFRFLFDVVRYVSVDAFPRLFLPKDLEAFRRRISNASLGKVIEFIARRYDISDELAAQNLTIVPETYKGRKGPSFDVYINPEAVGKRLESSLSALGSLRKS